MTPDHQRRLLFISRTKYCCAVFEDQPSITVTNVYENESSEDGQRLKRFCSTWNFCLGVDLETLELNSGGAHAIAEENSRLIQQRGAMREALLAAKAFGAQGDTHDGLSVSQLIDQALKENT